MAQNMFDTLLDLPLFQGLGQTDLTRIIESTHLDFSTLQQGQELVRQDALCTGVVLVIEGRLRQHTQSADRTWSVEEEAGRRSLIGLDVLYGGTRTHRSTYTAMGPTRVVFVDKRTVGALTAYFEVFRLNVLNNLTTQAMRRAALAWQPAPTTLEGHIIAFMRAHVSHPAGPKLFRISQQQLGRYLGQDYRFIAKALRRMEATQLIKKEYKAISTPAFETLINYGRSITTQ